jgi:hypothetical protein
MKVGSLDGSRGRISARKPVTASSTLLRGGSDEDV